MYVYIYHAPITKPEVNTQTCGAPVPASFLLYTPTRTKIQIEEEIDFVSKALHS